jgi:hypothetical protein
LWEESPITMGSGGKDHANNWVRFVCIWYVCMASFRSSNQFVYEEISPNREFINLYKKKLDNEVILEGFNFQ